MAPLKSLKWCVDSENKAREQTPGGIRGSDCTDSNPHLAKASMGGLERNMDGHTKALEVCQRVHVPGVSLNMPAGMSPQ